jgi:hypothetical protein
MFLWLTSEEKQAGEDFALKNADYSSLLAI